MTILKVNNGPGYRVKLMEYSSHELEQGTFTIGRNDKFNISVAGAALLRWLQKKHVYPLILYVIACLIVSNIFPPSPIYNFVSDELRVGDKYVLMYLVSQTAAAPLSDAEGADVFRRRRCGRCFVTNKKGFLPVGAYDAVLVHGDRGLLSDAVALTDPGKQYVLEASETCLRKELLDYDAEPRLTSFAIRKTFDLCGLCRHLHEERELR